MRKSDAKPRESDAKPRESIFYLIVKWFIIVLLFVYCISLLIPLIWALFTAFKPLDEYYLSTFALPKKITFSNFAGIFQKLTYSTVTAKGKFTHNFGDMFLTSVIFATASAGITAFFITVNAYVLTKYKFVGSGFLLFMGIFLMITPVFGTSGSSLLLLKAIGAYDNMLAQLILGISGTWYGMNFLIVSAGCKSISWSYAEAAQIDGAGHFQIFFKIMLPMILPTSMVIFLLIFLGAWNNYGTFLTILPSYANLAFGMYNFQYNAATNGAIMPEIMAGFIVVMIPTVALYFSTQGVIMSNFTIGGLKG